MAVGYNPRIITDKLVFCVDVANTKSYPGSGTSLYVKQAVASSDTLFDTVAVADWSGATK